MPDAYTDLATLAAAQPPDPRIGPMLVKTAMKWSYPGCPMDGTNLRLPRANVDDARVKSAISDGVWQAHEVDATGQPVKVVPVASIWAGRAPLSPAEAGGPRSWPPIVAFQFTVMRGTPLVMVGDANNMAGILSGTWLAAWKAGVVPHVDGQGIDATLLTLRVVMADGFPALQVGDRLQVRHGTVSNYIVGAVAAVTGNTYDLALSRYVPRG